MVVVFNPSAPRVFVSQVLSGSGVFKYHIDPQSVFSVLGCHFPTLITIHTVTHVESISIFFSTKYK